MHRLLPYLPQRIARAAVELPEGIRQNLTEIRLRLDGPVSATSGGKNRAFNAAGAVCAPEKAIICTKEDISECISLLTKASLYSYGDALCAGFLPFGNGCRAGVCGEATVRGGAFAGFSRIYGVNLRLCRFIRDYGITAARHISAQGLKGALVYSPPNKGKTTLLRSVAALLSREYRVALADERYELYVPQLKAGLTDAVCGLKKSVALPLLCRSMAPQVIVCDELAAEDEEALLNALGAGVCIIASAHAESEEGLRARPFIGRLLKTGAFPLLIGIGADFEYTVKECVE